MSSRAETLTSLADRVEEFDAVTRAWAANSFSDRLLVVELPAGTPVPADLERFLEGRGLRGANDVYGLDTADGVGFAGPVGDCDRHRFVDVDGRRRASDAPE